ncbi:MAG TPA: DUF2585 family protein [Pyrinomonadaceae bacterium]|jgi:hypothetical protein|nr:DUF2585 family protein [Pyrinomonadaceae bacterium]
MTEKLFSKQNFLPLILSVAAAILMVILLYTQGRIWWCKLGDYAIYVNEAWNSSHTSQHFLDPYTFTHVLHGVLFFWLASLIFSKFSGAWQFFIAIDAEAAWEVLENTNYIIEKYRENTASLDYFGDSILNSVGDLIACALGFWIAFKLGWWKSLIFFLLVEIVLLLWIRDGLLLNILMLIYPLDSVKNWQMNI